MNPDFSLSIFLNLYLHIFIGEVWNLALGAFAPHRNRENLGKIYVFLIVWTIVVSTFSWGNLGKNRETAFYQWFLDFSFFKKEGGEILLEEQIVNWIKCEKCNTKLIPIEAIIAQAWINRFHPPGITVHNFECPKCHTQWSCIIFSDDEAWGFLQMERKYVEKAYKRILEMRKSGMSVIQISYTIFRPPNDYIQ